MSAPAPQPQNHERKHEDSPKVADLTEVRSAAPCPVGGDGAICNSIQPVSTEKEQKPDSADKPKSCWTSEDKGSCYIQPVDTDALGKPNDPKVIEKLFPTYEKEPPDLSNLPRLLLLLWERYSAFPTCDRCHTYAILNVFGFRRNLILSALREETAPRSLIVAICNLLGLQGAFAATN